jgi:4a-hydroxytetrahydrobiopterin dehydratase
MWKEEENKLLKLFEFENFVQALDFINRVGHIAETQQHHPEIWNNYNLVKIYLTTHDENNNITQKDYSLANSIDKLYDTTK